MKTFVRSIDRNPTQLFASDFPLTKVQFLFYYFRTSLISLLSETFVSAIWNHVLPCFFFRKKIIYPNSRFHFCGQFSLPQSEVIKLFVFLPIDVSPWRGFRVRGNAVQLVITRAQQVDCARKRNLR